MPNDLLESRAGVFVRHCDIQALEGTKHQKNQKIVAVLNQYQWHYFSLYRHRHAPRIATTMLILAVMLALGLALSYVVLHYATLNLNTFLTWAKQPWVWGLGGGCVLCILIALGHAIASAFAVMPCFDIDASVVKGFERRLIKRHLAKIFSLRLLSQKNRWHENFIEPGGKYFKAAHITAVLLGVVPTGIMIALGVHFALIQHWWYGLLTAFSFFLIEFIWLGIHGLSHLEQSHRQAHEDQLSQYIPRVLSVDAAMLCRNVPCPVNRQEIKQIKQRYRRTATVDDMHHSAKMFFMNLLPFARLKDLAENLRQWLQGEDVKSDIVKKHCVM